MSKEVWSYAKKYLGKEFVSGIDHSERVLKWCLKIGEREKADKEILEVASILHDVAVPVVGRERHFEEGAKMAETFLKKAEYPEEKISKVSNVIRAHSRFGGPEPVTIEEKVLYDADSLDSLGAIGIVRALIRGYIGNSFKKLEEVPYFLRSEKNKISKFYTRKGEQVGRGRIEFMEKFIEELEKELNFEK